MKNGAWEAAIYGYTAMKLTMPRPRFTSHVHYDSIATNPDIQFFRHLRNACGHDGRWNFNELKHPAIWRDKELHMNLVGSVVFGGLLKHGDVVFLFTDIDKKCFEQMPPGGLTPRSSGAPVSVAAGCPRRCAPRRPLNAIVKIWRHAHARMTDQVGARPEHPHI
jgi:hypothetical protein